MSQKRLSNFDRVSLDVSSLLSLVLLQGPRPSAFIIEKTMDKGQTWQPALHLATDCRKSFPGIPTASPVDLDHTYCYTLPPTDEEPYRDHTVRTRTQEINKKKTYQKRLLLIYPCIYISLIHLNYDLTLITLIFSFMLLYYCSIQNVYLFTWCDHQNDIIIILTFLFLD